MLVSRTVVQFLKGPSEGIELALIVQEKHLPDIITGRIRGQIVPVMVTYKDQQ